MADQPAQQGDELERTMGRVVTIGTPIGAVLIALIAFLRWGAGPAVLVLTAGALVGAVMLLWSSLRSLVGDAPIDPGFDEAVVRARVSEASERKRMVLRALKDLENEHAVGKIDEADYAALAADYRARAKAILREMDDEIAPQRERAEQIARAHLQKKGLLKAGYRDATPPQDDDEPEEQSPPSRDKKRKKTKAAKVEPKPAPTPVAEEETSDDRRVCSECDTSNEPDATFCKKCGTRVGPEDSEDDDEQEREEEDEA